MLNTEFSRRRRTALVRAALTIPLLLSLLGLAVVPTWAAPTKPGEPFPKILSLTAGFRPEGIVAGRGTDFYVGSLADGTIYRSSFRTGRGEPLVTPDDGRIAVGLDYDQRSNALFVAGGPIGGAYVYDATSGEEMAAYQLTAPFDGFVNDVIVTPSAAYFTDSFQANLYRLPLAPDGGLPEPSEIEVIPLPAEFIPAPGDFGANGIEATPDGRLLILVHSKLGALYRVDTASGEIAEIDLGDGPLQLEWGDGLLLDGRMLYVVQNFFNQIAVVELEPGLASGEVVETLTDADFRIPTTVTAFGDALYAVNARFDVPPQSDTEYEVVRVAKP